MYKRIVAVFVALLLVVGCIKLHYGITDGFRVNKILNTFPSFLEEQKVSSQKLDKIFQGKFFYFGKGRQTYVFCREDGAYVIKFVRYHKYNCPLWAKFLNKYAPSQRLSKVLREQNERMHRAFTSYRLAIEELGQETHTVAVHWNSDVKINRAVIIVDRMGREFSIDLNRVGFVVQRKAVPFAEAVRKLYRTHQNTELCAILDSLIERAAYRIQQGICNRDYANAVRNSGVYKNDFMEMDIGSFYRDENVSFEKRLLLFLAPFNDFIVHEMPEYESYFQELVDKTLRHYAQNH
ncbi:MAG: hypothetical protein JW769_04120 [Parachlamydiales bacterium]|nr:hypothetical protein [Parachlamydiales bacterium]